MRCLKTAPFEDLLRCAPRLLGSEALSSTGFAWRPYRHPDMERCVELASDTHRSMRGQLGAHTGRSTRAVSALLLQR